MIKLDRKRRRKAKNEEEEEAERTEVDFSEDIASTKLDIDKNIKGMK